MKMLILTCSIFQICTSGIEPVAHASTVFWNKSTQPILIRNPRGGSHSRNSIEIKDRNVQGLLSIKSAKYFTASTAAENRQTLIQPSKQDLTGGSQLTIQLKRTKRHPRIERRDLATVQKIFKNRLNALDIPAIIEPIGTDKISVKLPGISNPKQAKIILEAPAQLAFREQKSGTEEKFIIANNLLREAQSEQTSLEKSGNLQEIERNQLNINRQHIEIQKLFDRAIITSKDLISANPESIDENGWNVSIKFNDSGSKAFAKLTKNLAGTGRSIGIFIDGKIISSPTVGSGFKTTGITGGTAIIMGNFSAITAADLSAQLGSGALPVPVEVIKTDRY